MCCNIEVHCQFYNITEYYCQNNTTQHKNFGNYTKYSYKSFIAWECDNQ
jgi:hypothetical protein